MNLKPQDIVILLKIAVSYDLRDDIPSRDTRQNLKWTYNKLANELFMSPAEVHAGVKRAKNARLINIQSKRPIYSSLQEFLIHGVKYAFPPDKGGMTRGVATSYAAPPLNNYIIGANDPPPVWPYVKGDTRGLELSPLYKTVPQAAIDDTRLYEALALVDAIRDGRAREVELAVKELKKRLGTV